MLISDPESKPQVVVFKEKNGKFAHFRQYLPLYLALVGAMVLSMWLGHRSINHYWQQTYHRASPLEALDNLALWRAGARVQQTLTETYDLAKNHLNASNERWLSYWKRDSNENAKSTETTLPSNNTSIATASAVSQVNSAPTNDEEMRYVYINAGDKVMFAGDSIMQGIAPHLQKWLKSRYQVDSINLSKQSTGLAYPSFFDWPATIEQTFQNDNKVKLLIILVGANDPWDFPDPAKEKGIPYLKFETPEWEKAYLQRVNRIVDSAKKANAQIIWLGIPYMKGQKLNTQMKYLETVLSKELDDTKDNVLWLPINRLLSDGAEVYQDSMILDNEPVRVRTKDGIHFTTSGQIFMSDYIASYIKLKDGGVSPNSASQVE